jgi:nicotinate-nucleotide--dimethylbenzimidazole phosphoribosyltransferase
LERVQIVVFAGNHGVVARGVSQWPAEVTAQMVANFEHGGAAINQLARLAGADLTVVPVAGLRPTADFTIGPAMSEAEFVAAVAAGYRAVAPGCALLCVGEMGIGNTTAAAAMAAALFDGQGRDWAGRGAGLDDDGVARKAQVIDAALRRHIGALDDPLEVARCLGGYELAAILGAVLAARRQNVPVLLDGFVSTAAAAPLGLIDPAGLDHARLSHRSAEAGHARLAACLRLEPLVDLGLRLGEASGAALAVPIVRAALACHQGMATFAEAQVAERDDPGSLTPES